MPHRRRQYARFATRKRRHDEVAREVDRTISDLADYERPKRLAAARRVANAEQKAALRGFSAATKR
jgi:hypothetical protein